MELLDRAFAAAYAALSPAAERGALADTRRELLAGLGGHVVDVGAGLGANLRHLGEHVERVTLLEPERHMARRLREAALDHRDLPFEVEVIEAPGEAMPIADGSVDAVVCTLVLCTVEDQLQTLAESRRVLVQDGRVALLEHIRAEGLPGRMQETIRPVWSFFGRGCDPARRTDAALEQAGFDLADVERREPGSLGLPLLVGIARPA